jgi:hypothetical protein
VEEKKNEDVRNKRKNKKRRRDNHKGKQRELIKTRNQKEINEE